MTEANEWSTRELGELIIRIIVLFIVVVIFFGLIKSLFSKKPVDTKIKDFERIISEIEDLNKNEVVRVPLFANDYGIAVYTIRRAAELNSNCKLKDSKYCACLYDGDSIITCKNIKKDAKIKEVQLTIENINYVQLEYDEDEISLNI